MPRYKVKLTRKREETAYAWVTASCPDEICIEEGDVEYAPWRPSWLTVDFEQTDIEVLPS